MDDRGFSLVETVVAVSLVAFALGALAQLFAMSTHANADARRTTVATVLAGQKMEQLLGAAADLEPRAVDSLDRNVPGLCDFMDEYGRSLGAGGGELGGSVVPAGTIFVRRWSIEWLPGSTDVLVLQVIVRHAGKAVRADWSDARQQDERLFGGAHLVMMKAREVG